MNEIPHADLLQRIAEIRGLGEASFILFEVADSEDMETIMELHGALMHIFQNTEVRLLITPGHVVENVHALSLGEMIELRKSLDFAIAAKLAPTGET